MGINRESKTNEGQKQWDIFPINITPAAFSHWGIDPELMQRFVSLLQKEGEILHPEKNYTVTFSDLKTIVAYLNDKGFDTSDLNTAIKKALDQQPKQLSLSEFKSVVKSVYRDALIQVRDDLQKNRWGGRSMVKNIELTATVKKALIPGFYTIDTTVTSHDAANPLKGWVAFFLHDTFSDEIKYVEVKKGVAKLHLNNCYEAFTLGAYTEDGTQLELDLNQVPGYPEGFYWKDLSKFQESVKAMYKEKPVIVKDDLQKNRWGGKNVNRDKVFSATVRKNALPRFYTVNLIISSNQPTLFTGEVAFFLHGSFGREIRFVRVKDGRAELKIKAYEAFTVGAYTEDGTSLELDLNDVAGYPKGFYYSRETNQE